MVREMTFGRYLKELRLHRNLRQLDLAEKIGVSVPFVCDIERDRRYPPEIPELETWKSQLELNEEEKTLFFDLAGDARETIPPDISKYLKDNPCALQAIRRIMGLEEMYNWNELI